MSIIKCHSINLEKQARMSVIFFRTHLMLLESFRSHFPTTTHGKIWLASATRMFSFAVYAQVNWEAESTLCRWSTGYSFACSLVTYPRNQLYSPSPSAHITAYILLIWSDTAFCSPCLNIVAATSSFVGWFTTLTLAMSSWSSSRIARFSSCLSSPIPLMWN